MSNDERLEWSYTDENRDPKTEPIKIQDKTFGDNTVTSDVRDPDGREIENPRTDGWYDQTPYGDEANYLFRLPSLFLKEIESFGILHWSPLTDYEYRQIPVRGTDGETYISIRNSGPGFGGAKEPQGAVTYWKRLTIFPKKHRSGGVPTISGVPDPLTQIKFSPGEFDTNTNISIFRQTPLTKKIDFTWAMGDEQGGMFSGVNLLPNTRYHAFAFGIPSANDELIMDIGFDTDITASHRPDTEYPYVRIGHFQTDIASNIEPFFALERFGGAVEYYPENMITQSFTGSLPAGRQLLSLPIIPGILPIAKITVLVARTIPIQIHVTPTWQTTKTASDNNMVCRVNTTGASSITTFDIAVDVNGQIAWERSNGDAAEFLNFTTRSWIDDRLV